MFKVTVLAFQEGKDGAEDALVKKAAIVNPAHVRYVAEVEMKKQIPIIGTEGNVVNATEIVTDKINLIVSETVEEIYPLLTEGK